VPFRLVLAPEVERDLAEAFDWYESQRAYLGHEFLESVDKRIQLLLRSPALFAVVFESYRRALLHGFPYAIFYEFNSHELIVYGILHTSRNPRVWQRRLL
jgi:plasmid stabilization system protein ParE